MSICVVVEGVDMTLYLHNPHVSVALTISSLSMFAWIVTSKENIGKLLAESLFIVLTYCATRERRGRHHLLLKWPDLRNIIGQHLSAYLLIYLNC